MDFLRRHRTKLALVTGVAAGSGLFYVVDRYLIPRMRLWTAPLPLDELALSSKKAFLLETHVSACNASILELGKYLTEKIHYHFNIEALVENASQEGAESHVDVWNRMKVLSVSRLVAMAYACGILVVVLRIQASILVGSVLGLDHSEGSSGPAAKSVDSEEEQIFLQSFQYFLQFGLPKLLAAVEAAARDALSSRKLTEKMVSSDLLQMLEQIYDSLDGQISSSLGNLVVPITDGAYQLTSVTSENGASRSVQRLRIDDLFLQLKVWLYSPSAKTALRWIRGQWKGTVHLFMLHNTDWSANPSKGIPFAKLIPVLTNCFLDEIKAISSSSGFLSNVMSSDQIDELSRSVFDSYEL